MKQAKEIHEEEARIFNLILDNTNDKIISNCFCYIVSPLENIVRFPILSEINLELDWRLELAYNGDVTEL